MSEQRKYRVTFGPVVARYATPMVYAGRKWGSHYVDQGGLLPDNIDPDQLRHLIDIGMVEPVPDPTPAEPATTD